MSNGVDDKRYHQSAVTFSDRALSLKVTADWWYRLSSTPLLIGHTLSLGATELDHTNNSPLYDLQSSFLLNTPFNGNTLGSLIEQLLYERPQCISVKGCVE